MPEYKLVDVTCYCGKQYPHSRVGEKIKCSCGVTLHTQQKKGGGHIYGTVRTEEKRKELITLIQSGRSKLEAQFVA